MAITATAPKAPPAQGSAKTPTQVRVGLRLKLVTAFTIAFTIVFGVLAALIIIYVTNEAERKLVQQLEETTVGGATTLNADGLVQVLDGTPAVDPSDPFLGQNALYRQLNQELFAIRAIVPNASPYTYFRDADGQLKWLTTWSGLDPDPNFTVPFRGLVSDVVPGDTYAVMEQGLQRAVNEEPFEDVNGQWISTFAPIVAPNGTTVGALGIDYPLSYVDEVRNGAIRVVLPILLVSYLALLALVIVVSTWLTRPLKRLTSATRSIAEGNYDIDLDEVIRTRVPDELAVLASSFDIMADKIRVREQKLTAEVTRLKVEIDSKKKERAVSEILESDFFAGIAAKADEMRSRMKSRDDEGGIAPSLA
jgi:HAMP domain-containing protein